MLADAKTLRNLRNRIASLRDLTYSVALKFFGEIRFAHDALLASNQERRRLQIQGLFRQWLGKRQCRIADMGIKTCDLLGVYPTRQRNAYVQRYNRTFRQEWLRQPILETIEEAQDHAIRRPWAYNNERPNRAIGRITAPAMKLKTAA